MLDVQTVVDHDLIIRRARQMRAEAVAAMLVSLRNRLFRRQVVARRATA
ncbi:MAG: hypothetical protein HC844_15745 [Tabrizicola sp.]|nr:hypothetical protein [Tabrizicola sp.]